VDPFNPYVLLGLARVNFELQNYGDTQDAFSRLETIDSRLAEEFSILRERGDEALEEALNSDLRRKVFWMTD
jgi:hypothetical protein